MFDLVGVSSRAKIDVRCDRRVEQGENRCSIWSKGRAGRKSVFDLVEASSRPKTAVRLIRSLESNELRYSSNSRVPFERKAMHVHFERSKRPKIAARFTAVGPFISACAPVSSAATPPGFRHRTCRGSFSNGIRTSGLAAVL